jgi:hypothetical protein
MDAALGAAEASRSQPRRQLAIREVFLHNEHLRAITITGIDSDAGARLFAPQAQARQNMLRAERASQRHEQSSPGKTTRFFRNVGIGLTLIGFGGFLYFQLGLFDS